MKHYVPKWSPKDLNDCARMEQVSVQLPWFPFYATSVSSLWPYTTTLETKASLYTYGQQHTRSGDKGFLHSEHVSALSTTNR